MNRSDQPHTAIVLDREGHTLGTIGPLPSRREACRALQRWLDTDPTADQCGSLYLMTEETGDADA